VDWAEAPTAVVPDLYREIDVCVGLRDKHGSRRIDAEQSMRRAIVGRASRDLQKVLACCHGGSLHAALEGALGGLFGALLCC
jgi:hypothetical protein